MSLIADWSNVSTTTISVNVSYSSRSPGTRYSTKSPARRVTFFRHQREDDLRFFTTSNLTCTSCICDIFLHRSSADSRYHQGRLKSRQHSQHHEQWPQQGALHASAHNLRPSWNLPPRLRPKLMAGNARHHQLKTELKRPRHHQGSARKATRQLRQQPSRR